MTGQCSCFLEANSSLKIARAQFQFWIWLIFLREHFFLKMDLSVDEIKRIIIKHSNRMRATRLLTRKGFLHSTPFHRTTLSRQPPFTTPLYRTPFKTHPFYRIQVMEPSSQKSPYHRHPFMAPPPPGQHHRSSHTPLHGTPFMAPRWTVPTPCEQNES